MSEYDARELCDEVIEKVEALRRHLNAVARKSTLTTKELGAPDVAFEKAYLLLSKANDMCLLENQRLQQQLERMSWWWRLKNRYSRAAKPEVLRPIGKGV